jgi:hypothetical protein
LLGAAIDPPVFANESPATGTQEVALLSPISVDITDVDGDLDASTVVLTVGGTVAWTGDAPANGWTGGKSAITNGYNYALTPPSEYPLGNAITVDVYAEDVLANVLNDSSWNFYPLGIHILFGINGYPYYFLYSRDGGQTWIRMSANWDGSPNYGLGLPSLDVAWGTCNYDGADARPRYGSNLSFSMPSRPPFLGFGALRGMSATANNAWFCGPGPNLWHWTGGDRSNAANYTLNAVTPYTTYPTYIWTVHTFSATDTWCASGSMAAGGYIYHWDGAAWTEHTASRPYGTQWQSSHASAPDNVVFCSGPGSNTRGVVRRWNGSTWDVLDLTSYLSAGVSDITDVYVAGPDDIWVTVGSNGDYVDCGIWYWNGSTWTKVFSPLRGDSNTRRWKSITGVGTDLVVAQTDDVAGTDKTSPIAIWNGSTWTEIDASAGAIGTNHPISVRALYTSFDFQVPTITDKRPTSGDTDVAPYQPVFLEVTDDVGVDAASVIIKHNGKTAWSGDAEQEGFSVTKSSITNGYAYSVLPHTLPARGDKVTVDVYAEDTSANSATKTWSYSIGTEEYVLRLDDFDDGALDPALVVINGNGSVTEPGGSELRFDCPNSTDCNWWASVDNAPKAYYPFEDWMQRAGVFKLESRLSGFDSTVVEAFGGGPMLYQGSQNVYYAGYYEAADDIRLERGVANTFSSRYNSDDNRADPNTTAHRYRLIWNRSSEEFVLPDGSTLQPGEITFYWSENDGASWSRVYTETMALSPADLLGFGVWLKKWNTGGTANSQAYVDYLSLSELVAPEELTVDPELGDGQIEADGAPVSLGGPEVNGIGQGLLMPGPPTQPLGSLGPFDDVQVEMEGEGSVQDPLADPYSLYLPTNPAQDSQIEMSGEGLLGVETDYRTTTNDFNGHPHFIGERVMRSFFYDAAAEAGPWTNPTDPSFTGYGKDGNYYVSGVDQGTNAPWADEAESDDRGPVVAFPDKALICYAANGNGETPAEIVIFDLDSFPTTLNVWMRFRFGPSGGNYAMMGRINQKPRGIAMANGILSVVCTEGDYRGHLILVNFTQPGKNCAHLIRSDTHYAWQPAGEIADRNLTGASQWTTTGVTVSLRTDEEQIYSVAAFADGDTTWVAIGGEDPGPNLYRIGAYPEVRVQGSGPDLGDANIGDIRKVAFDEDGNWWVAIQKRLHRILKYDYEQGYTNFDTSISNPRGGAREWIELPFDINAIVAVGDFMFIATEAGVYRAHRGSLDYALAYTIVGGGGGGTNDNPPDGELIPGEEAEVVYLTGHALHSAHYLLMATFDAVCVIRTLDDVAVDAREYPELHFPGPYLNIAMID